jgi:four helix bundle protein
LGCMSEEKITSFTKLIAWQKSHELNLAILKICESLPKYDFIRTQLERATLSITSNIAEGFGRQSLKDKKHFYVMARGSAYEVQNQLLIARDTNKLSKDDFKNLALMSLNSIRLLHGLIRSLDRGRNATS